MFRCFFFLKPFVRSSFVVFGPFVVPSVCFRPLCDWVVAHNLVRTKSLVFAWLRWGAAQLPKLNNFSHTLETYNVESGRSLLFRLPWHSLSWDASRMERLSRVSWHTPINFFRSCCSRDLEGRGTQLTRPQVLSHLYYNMQDTQGRQRSCWRVYRSAVLWYTALRMCISCITRPQFRKPPKIYLPAYRCNIYRPIWSYLVYICSHTQP